jgi:anthranilate phosphoribosyltransferase
LKNGKIDYYSINPRDFGLKIHDEAELIGGDAKFNSIAMLDILSDKNSAYKDAVIINSGAGIYIAGIANSISDGINIAKEKISNGEAKEKLKKLIEISNGFS